MLLAILILAAAGDAFTTIRFLEAGRRELNPIGRWFHSAFGNVAGTILAKALQVAFVAALAIIAKSHGYETLHTLILGAGIVANLFIVGWNLSGG
jgi:Na+-transporting NADH:ubiquinone oxidoreductase subunit NqrB